MSAREKRLEIYSVNFRDLEPAQQINEKFFAIFFDLSSKDYVANLHSNVFASRDYAAFLFMLPEALFSGENRISKLGSARL